MSANPEKKSPKGDTVDAEAAKRLVGKQVKFFRQTRGFSTRELAAMTSVTGSLISQIERGMVAPSLSTLLSLAGALSVEVGELFGSAAAVGKVVRRAERREIEYPDQGFRDEWLSADASGRLLVLRSVIDPGAESGPERLLHGSEVEFVFVLAGEIEILLGEQEVVRLAEGDSLTFPGTLPHGFRNLGGRRAELLWVVTPANY
ncbi:helix-turn-helix domain-containing protein [Leucobacter albus]|uniref:Helix-turn-helix domain-containing protein n=1 Tax=Leucobacter albus TaxID=272210 RepID=A0ABW3TNB7_9MICO